METPKQLFDTPVNLFFGDTTAPSPKAFVMWVPIWTSGLVPPWRHPGLVADGLRRHFVPYGWIETHGGSNS